MREDRYDPSEIESRWQERWEREGLYRSDLDRVDPLRPKHYALTMLPYPSGDLHIGHWYAIAPSDARARFFRMRGYNVMFPMGFDSFGLPAENAAIKKNIHPKTWTYSNIERMRGQLRRMGTMIDWNREAISADPAYYRWTQWFFLRLLAGDLAYRKHAAVDWCPSCNTTLAREQVWGEDRTCERCGTPVTKRELDQWFFRTTRYAEELLDFSKIDWPERVQVLQRNWIGRSDGAYVTFQTEAGQAIEVFTTRPDTLWGATFLVLAPEHPLVASLTSPDRKEQVEAYIAQTGRQSDIQRETMDREKTGVATGGFAINPVNGERIPVWIADYVLVTYGTGAIMAVPAHDPRDFEFAKRFGLPIRVVIRPEGADLPSPLTAAIPERGTMVDSGSLSGTPKDSAAAAVNAFLEERGAGREGHTYRLRDWLISRQRYWGAPIPIIHCPACGPVPVPESDLPVLLPDEIEWRPTGESPLKLHPTWKRVPCPRCGAEAERDTDTMDTFMCSSWYHLRYLSPHYDSGPFDPAEYAYWMPVDTYTGGIEHATMHLIYTRFFHKACRDLGILGGDEPMTKLRNQGMILGEDSEKMSKSRGNVVAPDDLVNRYGSDTVRAHLMFLARWDQGGPWSSRSIEGTSRWLRRVWTFFTSPPADRPADPAALFELRHLVHATLRKVTADFEDLQFNTIVAALMELLNKMTALAAQTGSAGAEWAEARSIYLRMLAPLAPHIAEELWHRSDLPGSVHLQDWPRVDEEAARDLEVTLVVQVDGKVRDRISVPAGITEADALARAQNSESVQRFLGGREPQRVKFVPDRLVNLIL